MDTFVRKFVNPIARPAAGLRETLLLAIGTLGSAAVLGRVAWEYSVTQWVLSRAVGNLTVSVIWALLCLGAGLRILDWIAFRHPARSVRATVAFPLGVFTFGALVYVTALFGGFGPIAFFVLPLGLGAIGAKPLIELVARVLKSRFRPLSRLETVALVYGALGLVLVYVPLLTPQNIQHDARWYHLPIAAQYAASGAASGFPEGWLLATYPHFSSYLYAWCLAAPLPIVERLALAAHLEFIVFLATLASIPIAARCLLPGRWARLTWSVVFLFPGLFVYDSNLGTGADHIAALFGPAALALLFLPRQAWFPRSFLLGVLAGATMLTKYSAVCLAGPILLGAILIARSPRSSRLEFQLSVRPTLVVLMAFLLAWSPHWLANWMRYNDPLYPLLNAYLPSKPWNADIAQYFRTFELQDLLRPQTNLAGLLLTLKTLFTLGFDVNEYDFHGNMPTFGFLFSVCLFFVPFARLGRKHAFAYGLTLVGVGIWYWVNHRDRYLQVILPWMVCLVACVLRALWVSSRRARWTATALVLSQAVAGAGVFTISSHIMIPGGHPLPHVLSLISEGYSGKGVERFGPYDSWQFADWVKLGKLLPMTARVLVHEDRLWTGLDRPVVVDEAAWQGGIRYASAKDTREIHQILRRYAVTHVITGRNHPGGGFHGIRGEALFRLYIDRHARQLGTAGGLTAWELPLTLPDAIEPQSIYLALCNRAPGTYPWNDAKNSDVPLSPTLADGTLLAVVESGCGVTPPSLARILATRDNLTFSTR